MKNRLIATVVTGALAAMTASAAFGQADPKNSAYWLEQYGTPDANVWRNSTGLCWRAGYWTPAMAIKECDPDLVVQVAAPAPAPAAARAAAARAAAARADRAEDHAGQQGAVRFRQGGAEA